MKAKILEVAYV